MFKKHLVIVRSWIVFRCEKAALRSTIVGVAQQHIWKLLVVILFCSGAIVYADDIQRNPCDRYKYLTFEETVDAVGFSESELKGVAKVEAVIRKSGSEECLKTILPKAMDFEKPETTYRILKVWRKPIIRNEKLCESIYTEYLGLDDDWKVANRINKKNYIDLPIKNDCGEYDDSYVLMTELVPDSLAISLLRNSDRLLEEYKWNNDIKEEYKLASLGVDRKKGGERFFVLRFIGSVDLDSLVLFVRFDDSVKAIRWTYLPLGNYENSK